jgi:hypothetical protein
MRSLVLRIFSRRRQSVTAIFYVLTLLFFTPGTPEVTGARTVSFEALRLEPQNPAPSTAPSTSQKKKSLAPIRKDEAPEGSRLTITYNEPLSDYAAYRRGNQFVVVIPKADAPRISSGLRGRGFESVQVEKRGDDTVLSFRIQPGVKARVDQQFNRLEVIFSSPGQTEAKATTQQATAAAALTSQGKAPQSTQTSVGLSQTPLANHNTDAAQPDQTKDGSVSVDSSAEPAVALTQPNAAAPAQTTLTQTPEVSTAPSQAAADKTNTEQPSPPASPRTGFAAARMLITRNWLPVLIAALLLASAYMVIAARRRTERSSSSNSPLVDAHAELSEGVEASAEALSIDNSVEITSPVEETGPARATETEMVAESNIAWQAADVASSSAASALSAAGMVAAYHHEDSEIRASESSLSSGEAPGVSVEEEPEAESIESAAAQSNHIGVADAEAAQMILSKEPAAVESGVSRTSDKVFSGVSSAMASELAAAMIALPPPGSEDAFCKISAAFDHPSQPVRNAAARALFNFSPDRVASFKRIMQESSEERRRKIGAAIASSGMALEAINDLTSRSGEKAYEALLVLSLMAKAGEVKSLILTIEEHPSTEVRLALVKLLALSGQQEALTAFRQLAKRDSLPIAVRSSIMEALHQINDPGSFDLSSA